MFVVVVFVLSAHTHRITCPRPYQTTRDSRGVGYIVRQRADAVLDADEDRTRINEVAGAGVQLVSLDNEPAEKWGEVFGVDGAGTVCSLVNAPDGCEATLADLNSR